MWAKKIAPDKSEILILKKRTIDRPPAETPDPEVTIHGATIPKVDTLRVLGLTFQKDGAGAATLQKLQNTVTHLTHTIRRVTSKKHGLKEEDTMRTIRGHNSAKRIVHELPVSRIT
ncbi:hypothetical protein HPB48_004700 [Haemaphysalis longicornis]|uniref:Uncharacterized protein n=1 Tax=Haemaphysalis longicornis TaxID=44386 RepID=A0A9J6G1L9_HAELO|nr:hypothetical protein HPB48_004700 [Haemaphysalis longicornis]